MNESIKEVGFGADQAPNNNEPGRNRSQRVPADVTHLPPPPNSVPKKPKHAVGRIVKGRLDCYGEKIMRVFFRRGGAYAIYQTPLRVAVQYADDDKLAKHQIASLSQLSPLRDQLQYLASGLRGPHCYFEQIAEAFRLGLEGHADTGKRILDGALADATRIRERSGRLCYLMASGLVVALIAIVAGFVARAVPHIGHTAILDASLAACAGGAVGAMLSVAIGIRNRTISINSDSSANSIEGALRILIGVISAGALFLILTSGLLKDVTPIDMMVGDRSIGLHVALLIGFAGGFLERLVPDLLEKGSGRLTASSTPSSP